MERNQLLAVCNTQILTFEEFKNFDANNDENQVRNENMEIIIAYGQYILFLDLKKELEKNTNQEIDRNVIIEWLSNRHSSQYKNFEFQFNEKSPYKIRNEDFDVKLSYANWDASQTLKELILKTPSFCEKTHHSFP